MVYVYNAKLELQGIIETFFSFQLTEYYNKVGTFELHCFFNKNILKLLQLSNILSYNNNSEQCVYIETINITVNQQGQEIIVAKGKTMSNYLNFRVIWNYVNENDTAENIIKKLILNNAINPINNNRKIPLLSFEENKLTDKIIHYTNCKHTQLADEISNICIANNLGFNIRADFVNRKLLFYVYAGANRAYNNNSISPVLFSRDFENILEQNFLESNNNYKNSCLIYGAGEGSNRQHTFIGNNEIGLNRKELYVDARDIPDKKQIKVMVQNVDQNGKPVSGQHEETKEIEVPWNEYEPKLLTRGKDKLSKFTKTKSFISKVNNNSNNIYIKDFYLGDTVTIKDEKWGLIVNTQVTSVSTIINQSGLSILPTFGNTLPDIFTKIKNERECL